MSNIDGCPNQRAFATRSLGPASAWRVIVIVDNNVAVVTVDDDVVASPSRAITVVIIVIGIVVGDDDTRTSPLSVVSSLARKRCIRVRRVSSDVRLESTTTSRE